MGGLNLPPLIGIGLTDLPKIGGANGPPPQPIGSGITAEYDKSHSLNMLEHERTFARHLPESQCNRNSYLIYVMICIM